MSKENGFSDDPNGSLNESEMTEDHAEPVTEKSGVQADMEQEAVEESPSQTEVSKSDVTQSKNGPPQVESDLLEAGNGELKAGNGEVGAGNGELEDGDGEVGAGNGELEDGDGEVEAENEKHQVGLQSVAEEHIDVAEPSPDIPEVAQGKAEGTEGSEEVVEGGDGEVTQVVKNKTKLAGNEAEEEIDVVDDIAKNNDKLKEVQNTDLARNDKIQTEHMESDSLDSQNTLNCAMCPKTFKNRFSYKKHILRHENACCICNRKFTLICHLAKHMKAHERKMEFPVQIPAPGLGGQDAKPEINGEQSESPISSSHVIPIIPNPVTESYSCIYCPEKFTEKDSLDEHVLSHKVKKTFRCNVCSMSFKHQSVMIRHQLTHKAKKAFNCVICECKFKHLKSLINHLIKHADPKDIVSNTEPIHCPVCNKYLTGKQYLAQHVKIHAEVSSITSDLQPTVKTPYTCNVCHKDFPFRSILVRHAQSHKRKKKSSTRWQYECPESDCSSTFGKGSNLVKHMKSHHSNLELSMDPETESTGQCICTICLITFPSMKAMEAHKISKHGIGEDEKHTNKMNTKQDLLTNEDQEPYPCDICDSKFWSRDEQLVHLREHSGEEPFTCTVCDCSFSIYNNLKKHLVEHKSFSHPNSPVHDAWEVFDENQNTSFDYPTWTMAEDPMKDNEGSFPEQTLATAYVVNRTSSPRGKSPENDIDMSEDIGELNSDAAQPVGLYQHQVTKSDPSLMNLKPYEKINKVSCPICRKLLTSQQYLDQHMKAHGVKLNKASPPPLPPARDPRPETTKLRRLAPKPFKRLPSFTNDTRDPSEKATTIGDAPPVPESTQSPPTRPDGVKQYPCPHCPLVFNRIQAMIMHRKKHQNEPRGPKCKVCDRKFTKLQYLVMHMRSHTPNEKLHRCPVCDKRFSGSQYLMIHMKARHNRQMHSHISSTDTKNKAVFYSESKSTAPPLESEPRAAPLEQVKRQPLDPQPPIISVNRGAKYHDCPVCRRRFTRIQAYIQHLKRHRIFQPYSRDINSSKYRGDTSCGVSRGRFPCTLCPRVFNRSQSLGSHMKRHKRSGDYVKPDQDELDSSTDPDYTDPYYTDPDYTGSRPSTGHSSSSNKHICEVCGKKFIRRQRLAFHMRTHVTGPNPITRTHIRGLYPAKRTQIRGINPIKRIRGRNPKKSDEDFSTGNAYSCSVCGFEFPSPCGLKRHMLTHEKDKYTCKVCLQSFSQSSTLKHHMLTHDLSELDSDMTPDRQLSDTSPDTDLLLDTEIEFLSCVFCFNVYSTLEELEEHMLTHEENKADIVILNDDDDQPSPVTVTCKHCGEKYNDIGLLLDHLKTCGHSHTMNLNESVPPASLEELKAPAGKDAPNAPLSCYICFKPFTYMKSLEKHVMKHINNNDSEVSPDVSSIQMEEEEEEGEGEEERREALPEYSLPFDLSTVKEEPPF